MSTRGVAVSLAFAAILLQQALAQAETVNATTTDNLEECVDSDSNCPRWANQCHKMKRKFQCPKTCGTCGMCLDGLAKCSTKWSDKCQKMKAQFWCPKTCGTCGMCLDSDPKCSKWSDRCSTERIRQKCHLTCGVCQLEEVNVTNFTKLHDNEVCRGQWKVERKMVFKKSAGGVERCAAAVDGDSECSKVFYSDGERCACVMKGSTCDRSSFRGRNVYVVGEQPVANDFAVTTGTYADTADIACACVDEFGSEYRVADWEELEAMGAQSVNELMDDLGVPTTFNSGQNYHVSRRCEKFYNGGPRVYFFERHGGNPPGNWMVHSILGDITLGSWYDTSLHVLCAKNTTSWTPICSMTANNSCEEGSGRRLKRSEEVDGSGLSLHI